MAIGTPRWGGIRPDPYNPDSPDADNDGIVQEGTFFERPAGTRIVSALTGLELELGTPGNSLQDVGDVQIVDREGRPVPYRQSWSGGTLTAGERNGTLGNSNGTVGGAVGNLDGPPPAPKPDAVQLRSTDVDKNGKPLRVFVSDDRRFHGAMPTDWAGFDNPAWREADAHWGGSLRDGEMPISANDPRLPDTLFYVTRNPSAQRDLGVVRTDGDRVDLFYSREDADAALAAVRADDPGAGILSLDTDNIRTGAAVTLRDGRVSVFGDVRLDADSAPEPVRREADIPTPDSLDPIKDRFDAEGFELYLVGGAVRDTLMGREIKDYDLASDATPDQIEAMLADVDGARLDLTGKDFAVVRVNMPDGEEYEIATFRRDVGEGRRPDEVEFTTIDEDVRRRDLTMNALFYDLSTGEIVDYVGGIEDIESGVVRAVGDPAERFREDPLRILRAFRFSGRTGWGMDSATVDAIRANSALRGVSGERVHEEFVRGIDSAVSPAGYIQQIDIVDNGTGVVWGQIFPGLNVSPSRLPADGSYGNRSVLVASLLADNDIDSVKAVLKDRKFTNDEIADVELIMQARSINDGNVATLKNKFGKNDRVSADDMRAFHSVQPETEDEIEPFLQFADAPPALTANDLQEQGIKPGPQFGAMLREAEEQRYREIRDGFSVGGDAPEAATTTQALDVDRDKSSFRDADRMIDEAVAARPELASDSDAVRAALAPAPGEDANGYAFRTPSQLEKRRDAMQVELDSFLETATEQDLEEYADWVEYLQADIEQSNVDIANEGVWETIGIWTYTDDADTPESVQQVLDSERMRVAVNRVLSEVGTEHRTSRIAISPVSASGDSIPGSMGYYFPEEDTIYLHPDFFTDVFRDEGIPFEDFAKWANTGGAWRTDADYDPEQIDLYERDQLEDIADNVGLVDFKDLDDVELIARIEEAGIPTIAEERAREIWESKDDDERLVTERRELILHENAHGIHFRKDGQWDGEGYVAIRDEIVKALKDTELLQNISEDGEAFNDPDNYFQYIMKWTAEGGKIAKIAHADFLDANGFDRSDKKQIADAIGAELFAEAITHAMLGRKFPGSEAIAQYINEE